MSYIFGTGFTRPNRLTTKKNQDYHRDFGKYCLGVMGHSSYRRFLDKCLINWSFFKGGDGQWIFDEDVESFFLDESGDIRNRLKWTKNVIKPMVQQYVGNAIRLSYDAKAECVSDFVINEREKKINELSFYHEVSDSFPWISTIIQEKAGIEETFMESREMFFNMFVEDHEEDVNNLITFVVEDVNMDELKVQITRNLAICGLGIYKGFESGEIYDAEATNPLFFFWDLSAKKPDLTDSEYQGEWYYMDAPSLFEKYPKLNKAQREGIEAYGRDDNKTIHKVVNGMYTQAGGKVPVYEIYWKDVETREYGWVMDEFNYPYYTMINHEDSQFTDADLIEPQTEKHKEELGDKKKHKIFVDVLRYCVLIPQEEIGVGHEDIVLEYGIVPYQEKKLGDPSSVKFPYKCYTWVYDRGEILTPLDDVIDPQRFLNRTISVIESQMSNMRGTGTVISKSAVDPRDGELDTLRNMNASKPIFVDTDRVGSVQNAIGQYGTNIGNGTLQMFQVVSEVQKSIADVTGVNESMTGTGQTSDALVGVIEAQIQRGSLVQEPFYWALTSILKQAYEHISTVGKAVYFDNPRRLAMMVGDKGMKNIILTKDHLLQDYRIFIKRAESKEKGEEAGNQLLFTLLQSGLIDQNVFSNLFGRATPDRIAKEMRAFVRANNQAQNQIEKAQMKGNQIADQKEAELVQGMEEGERYQGETNEINEELNHEREMEKIAFKEQMKSQQ
tara:strand:+ start:5424 stop:7604 length:2181 start_codon:yes stop_codon:yes gene_type:complete